MAAINRVVSQPAATTALPTEVHRDIESTPLLAREEAEVRGNFIERLRQWDKKVCKTSYKVNGVIAGVFFISTTIMLSYYDLTSFIISASCVVLCCGYNCCYGLEKALNP